MTAYVQNALYAIVHLSVCHTGGSVKDSWSKDHASFTTQ